MQATPEYCLLWIQHWAICMPRAEWAAWIQAAGSLAVIIASVWIVQIQHRLERRRRAEASGEAVNGLKKRFLVLIREAHLFMCAIGHGLEIRSLPSPGNIKVLRNICSELQSLEVNTALEPHYQRQIGAYAAKINRVLDDALALAKPGERGDDLHGSPELLAYDEHVTMFAETVAILEKNEAMLREMYAEGTGTKWLRRIADVYRARGR
jgi:hypothetical protein